METDFLIVLEAKIEKFAGLVPSGGSEEEFILYLSPSVC